MLIIEFPTLINPIEYVEFFNPSGICELRLNKSKLKFKYDWLVQYIRSQGLNDAENITALLDYRTGKSVSKNLRQYSQFTIIRHPGRRLNFGNLSYCIENNILLDDRDFVIGCISPHDYDIYKYLSARLKRNKTIRLALFYADNRLLSQIISGESDNSKSIWFIITLIPYIRTNLCDFYIQLPTFARNNMNVIDRLWLFCENYPDDQKKIAILRVLLTMSDDIVNNESIYKFIDPHILYELYFKYGLNKRITFKFNNLDIMVALIRGDPNSHNLIESDNYLKIMQLIKINNLHKDEYFMSKIHYYNIKLVIF